MVLGDHLQRVAAPAGRKRSYTSPTPAVVSLSSRRLRGPRNVAQLPKPAAELGRLEVERLPGNSQNKGPAIYDGAGNSPTGRDVAFT